MRKLLWAVLCLSSSFAYAADVKIPIQKATANIYSSPSTSSEVLVTLKKGSKVSIAGVTEDGSWAKVKVTVSGFQFDGWVQREAIAKPRVQATSPVAKAAPVPAPRVIAPTPPPAANPSSSLTSSSTNELDKFFEPSGTPSQAAPAQQPQRVQPQSGPAPALVQRQPAPVKAQPKPKVATVESAPDEGGNKWTHNKLVVYGMPGYSFLQYTFRDATKDAFRYNLAGLSLEVGADYQILQLFNDLIRIGSNLDVQYVFYNTKTNLLDGTGMQFSDLTASNRLLDIDFKVKLMVNFEKFTGKPFLVGVSGGYDYLKFTGDDIVADDSTAQNLYIGQTTKTIPIGLIAELHFLDPVAMTIGANLLFNGSASESPANTSGTNPKPGTGFEPYLNLDFPLVGRHFMGISYRLRVQETDFTGATMSRVNNTLNDANALQFIHTIALKYAYHF